MTHPTHARRAGWTLIEMLVTISVMAVLTTVAVKTLSAMLTAERNGVQHVVDLGNVSRLANQFRQDVHLADAIEVNTDGSVKPLLRLKVAEDYQIEYQVQDAGLLRTERRTNQTPGFELWRLKQTQFQCVATSDSPRFVTLILRPRPAERASTKPTAVSREIRIDAVLGRDR